MSQGKATATLPLEAIKALHTHAFRHLFGLLLFSSDRVDVGTGVGIKLGSRFFVATAGHNFCGFADNSIALVHLDHISSNYVPFISRWPPISASDPQPDIGFLELAPDVARKSDKQFLSADRIQPAFSHSSGNVLLVGYPAECVPQCLVKQDLFQLCAMAFTTSTVEPGDCGLDPDQDIALEYHDDALIAPNRSPTPTPKPPGLSGAGVWSFPRPRQSGVWSPSDSKLIGIQRAWLPRSHLVVCTQMQHWLNLVAEKYPDLASTITAIQGN